MISSSDIHNARILIVDDQQANVTLLERILAANGYKSVSSTIHAREVCELHRKNRYDLILLDLHMPGMDGFEVIECLKASDPDADTPVLVITAQPESRLRALKAGAKDFISKPFEIAEIKVRVYNMLEIRMLHAAVKKQSDPDLGDQQAQTKTILSSIAD
jgi:DNA-binding response OmpR family regulator